MSSTPPWSPLNPLDRKNGKAVAKVLASESPSRGQAQIARGGEIFPAFDAVLDGDDMTLELVTELNEGEVDEEVGALQRYILLLLTIYRFKLPKVKSCRST